MSLDSIVGRLERAVNKLDPSGGSADAGGEPLAVTQYKEYVKEHVEPFIANLNKFPELKQLSEWTRTAFDFQGTAIGATAVCAKPTDEVLLKFLDPIVKVINDSAKCDNRSEFFPHQKAFNEAIQALGWLMQPGPKAAITAQLEAADLYFNKVLTLAKNKTGDVQTNHRDFVKLLKAVLSNLAEYANDNFKLGLTWKTGGADLAKYKPGDKPAAAATETKVTVESRLEALAGRLEKLAAKKGGDSKDGKSAAVAAYEEFAKDHVTVFVATLDKFPELKQLSEWTKTAFDFQGKVIAATAVCAKPTDEALLKFLDPIVKVINDSGKCDNRSEFFPHQKAFNEAIQALGWLMQPGPKAAITAQLEAADLYFNKVLTLAKNKTGDAQTNHRDFVKNLKALLSNLAEFAGEHYKMGLTWKAGGQPITSFK